MSINNLNTAKPPLLIIANSGRMLVQAAKQLGFNALVIDLYADIDTQLHALAVWQVSALSIEQLTPVLDRVIADYGVKELLYASGFETQLESLAYLQTRLAVLGNSFTTFQRVQNKKHFFSVLQQLAIPHPETRFSPPDSLENWLMKPKHNQGGVSIKFYQGCHNDTVYWQRYQAGTVHSVLFLADGKQFQIVGFNTQWTTDNFLFAGIINDCPLSLDEQAQVKTWLTKLVSVFELQGLNTLDFIHAEGQNYLLEINPRLSASLQLYDAQLLLSHIENSLSVPKCSGYTGYQIVYAAKTVRIPDNMTWHNCVDLPKTGQICQTGQPICSIIVHKSQPHEVRQVLNNQQQFLEIGLYTNAISSER